MPSSGRFEGLIRARRPRLRAARSSREKGRRSVALHASIASDRAIGLAAARVE
jgi:hypothetical protein